MQTLIAKCYRAWLMVALTLAGGASGRGQSPEAAKAIAFEQQGTLEDAARAPQTVIELDPRDAAACASLGLVLSKGQKYPAAAAAYRQGLTLNPKLPRGS